MEVKENRPDACAASGTANSIYKDFSTDAPDIQEELTGPVLPDECAADIVSFCSEQTIAYDDLLEYATLFYLQDKDPEDPPFRDTLKFELLTLTNRCIDAYNFGKRDPNAAPGAKLKDAYPDKKEGAERYKRLSGLHTLQIAIILYKLHHAVGILWNNSHDDGNFDIGIYQYSGDNEGCYDVGEQNLKSLIRGYCKTGTMVHSCVVRILLSATHCLLNLLKSGVCPKSVFMRVLLTCSSLPVIPAMTLKWMCRPV